MNALPEIEDVASALVGNFNPVFFLRGLIIMAWTQAARDAAAMAKAAHKTSLVGQQTKRVKKALKKGGAAPGSLNAQMAAHAKESRARARRPAAWQIEAAKRK